MLAHWQAGVHCRGGTVAAPQHTASVTVLITGTPACGHCSRPATAASTQAAVVPRLEKHMADTWLPPKYRHPESIYRANIPSQCPLCTPPGLHTGIFDGCCAHCAVGFIVPKSPVSHAVPCARRQLLTRTATQWDFEYQPLFSSTPRGSRARRDDPAPLRTALVDTRCGLAIYCPRP